MVFRCSWLNMGLCHITNHLLDNNILCDNQHGFCKNRLHETQLISLIDDLASSIRKGSQTDCLSLDFVKAFDKANHSW